MNILLCKPNLVGFLSAVYDSYYIYKDTDAVTSDENAVSLLDAAVHTEEEVEKAVKVRAGIIKKGGAAFYDDIATAYLSGQKHKEGVIFDYLRLFFKAGKKVTDMYGDASVAAFNDILRKVGHEIHRLSAFIRLQEMANGVYYGFYNSDNDILERLMPLFIPKFNTMRFVIHDVGRRKMAFFDGNGCHYGLAPDGLTVELSDAELFFQRIWNAYHKNVSIAGRENPRLQRGWLPKKYRHFMNEF